MYPPLLHSTALLAEAGCAVHVLGLDTMNGEIGAEYPPGVQVTLLPSRPSGWKQKAQYGRFAWRALGEAARLQPDWLYASDALAAPAAALVRARRPTRLVYHEHDTPMEAWAPERASAAMRQVMRARHRAVKAADICVVPNAERARALERDTRRADIDVVWNCPRREEAETRRARHDGAAVRFLYQGSVVPARLPVTVIDAFALADARAHLVIAGYNTAGHPGYVDTLLSHARSRGLADRVSYAGVLNRTKLLRLAATCDVGVALFPVDTTDPNESTMVGASNKAFEYLARGLPLIVSDRPEWRETFVLSGLARACDPSRPESVAAALTWFAERASERCAMGERGRQRVLADWNYETAFAPVLAKLVAPADRPVG